MTDKIFNYIFLIFIIFLTNNCWAQKAQSDSILNNFLSHQVGSRACVKASEKIVSDIGDSYNFYNEDLKSKIEDNGHKKNPEIVAHYYYLIAYSHFLKEEDIDAVKNFLTALNFVDSTKNNYLRYSIHFRLANSYARIQFYTKQDHVYHKALYHYNIAIPIIEKLSENSSDLITIYTLIAHAYHGIKEFEKSESYYKKAEDIALKSNNSKAVVRSILNRGNLYLRYKHHIKAEQSTLKAFAIADSIDYPLGKAYCQINLCQINAELLRFESSLKYAQLAHKESEIHDLPYIKFRSNQEQAKIYTKLKKYDSAILYYNKCITNLSSHPNQFYLKKVLSELAEIYSIRGEYKNANKHLSQYLHLNDSLNNIDYKKRIKVAESIHQHEATVFKNKLLEKENTLHEVELKMSKLILLSALALIFLLVISYIIQSRAKNKYKSLSKKILTQKNIISSQNNEIIAKNKDLNDYKINLEKLVEERTLELKEALNMAQESNQFKNAFLENISHEIRTPMNAIIGFTELLEFADENEFKHSIDLIIQNSEELLETVEGLVEIAKLKTSIKQLSLTTTESTYFNQAIFNYVSILKSEIFKEKATLTVELSHFDGTITTDINKLCRILKNLLDNAIKFSPKGNVNLSSFDYGDEIEFIIEDDGIGISPEKLNDIFGIFRKFEVKQNPHRGIGIGLSIVDKLIQKLDGSMTVESELNKGTKFSFRIPKNLIAE
ncbi:tetratricopeptide repeat-containing sensor histidine kinase [Labilibacter marinus]|uniref:tetratricopeptide repeat-containing sensor histidine kinase n=1 Tax=Labilibacter marinus TaxID=1477105 RepID=UPI00082E6EF7|nr:tetratricopeptide repeat-containing sensor histidine kinase [Labilibacter marinus]